MTELLLFHHAQGLTPGVLAFADDVRAAGHVVHTPDLYDGQTFSDIPSGVGHARDIGFDTVIQRGRRAAADLPDDLVYAGFSLGVMPAQALAQSRPGARGAVLMHSFLPPSELGGPWPAGVPLQIHFMDRDPEGLPPNGDLQAAREADATIAGAQLFLYPGDGHLFADNSLPGYDEAAATLLTERVVGLLDGLGRV